MRRRHRALLGTMALLLAIAAIAVLMLTQTDWGRRHVLAFGLNELASRVHGKVAIAEIHGNLLSGVRLNGVVITDTANRPFLRADTVDMRYSLRSLVRQHLTLSDIRIVDALIVLDQPPGEEWNFNRIFPTGDPKPGRGPGFGSWVMLEGLTLKRGTIIVRANTQKPGSDSRLWVVPVGNGYQSISEFLNVNGYFPLMRLADPDSVNRLIMVDSLNMIALPFKPPSATVQNFSGRVVITKDSLLMDRLRIRLPGTTGAGVAAYALNGKGARVQMNFTRASSADARFIKPDIPPANGRLALAFTNSGSRTRVIGSNMDMNVQGATIRGRADFTVGEPGYFRIGPSNVSFARLSTGLIRRFAPGIPLTDGTLNGRVALQGVQTSMDVNGDVRFTERRGPTSHILADGVVGESNGVFHARGLNLRFRPLYLSLVRKFEPRVPYRGAVTGTATLTGSTRSGFAVVADLVDNDPSAGRSHILANGRIDTRDGFSARNLRLRFEPLQMAMVKPFAPDIPYGGTIAGTTTLTGSMRRGFDVDANIVHNSAQTGRSHIRANGWVSVVDGITARSLRLGFSPLQIAAVKPFARSLPLDGVLSGTTTVSGSLSSRQVRSIMDLTHTGSTGTSRVIGRATMNWGRAGVYDVDVRTPALSLATVGRFMPGAGLRGSAAGHIVARGARSNVRADLNLAFGNNGGAMHTVGTFDLTNGLRSYDFTSTLTAFNAAAVTTRAPGTMLTGHVTARGAGTDPATANATVNARLFGAELPGTPRVDTAIVRARVADGLATFDTAHIRLGSARGDFIGSFGLVANRSGTLRYSFAIDTLSRLGITTARDTVIVRPRPLVQARAIERARADSIRIAEATEVQRAAVGYPLPPALRADTIAHLRRDTISGGMRAEGTLTGNIKRFDAEGAAQARSFAFKGNYIGRGRARYDIKGFGTRNATIRLNAFGDTVRLAGFAFDSARADIDYAGVRTQGAGKADLAFFQDPDRDYRVISTFNLSLDEKRLALQTLQMRFDTTRWEAPRPAVIAFGKAGVTIDNFELRSNTGGLLRAHGRLPNNGNADLRIDVDKLQLSDVSGLIQDTLSLEGLLNLRAHLRGSTKDPSISGSFALDSAVYGGTWLPDVRSTFTYASRNLTSHFDLFRNTTRLATGDAQLPINLALSGVTGPRLMRDAPVQLDMRADSLPLDALPRFTTAVSDVRGRLRGDIDVRGTINNPQFSGIANLDLGRARVTASGVLYENVLGTIRLQDNIASVDSIVAQAGRGTIRTVGSIDFTKLMHPGFDLRVAARDALLVDNYRGRLHADADLTIEGPFNGVRVRGDVKVKRGVVFVPEMRNRRVTNLEDPTLRSTLDTAALGLAALPKRNPFLSNLDLDVGVRIARDTWARNLQLNVEIYTPEDEEALRVRMNNAHHTLSLNGIINADRGEYTYSGRNFELSTGSLTFLDGPTIDPFLNLTARYEVQRRGAEALTIQIHVDGNLTQPRVTLASNAEPPLSQSDMLAYLAFGQSASSVMSMQSSAAFGLGNGGLTGLPALAQQQLASLAFGATIDQMVADIEQAGTRNGLDVFRVNAGEMPAEAAFQSYFQNIVQGTEIEAGKYLSPRLFLEARGRTNTVPGVSLQYRNPAGWIFTGTYEPRYIPAIPSFSSTITARQKRSLGVLLLWQKRF